MGMTVGERLVALKQRSGMSMGEIARLAGYAGPSSIQRYFAPEYDPSVLDYRFALKLVDAMQGAGTPPIDGYEIMALTDRGAMDIPGSPIARRPDMETKEWIYVYGTEPVKYRYAQHDGEFEAEAVIIERGTPDTSIEAPPFLAKREVYAFFHSGQSMHPRIEDGEIVFTEGKRRVTTGDYVVVVVEERVDDHEAVAILGALTLRTSEYIELTQPAGTTIRIPIESVSSLRRIMKAHELINAREVY
jgi:hypothetical protein